MKHKKRNVLVLFALLLTLSFAGSAFAAPAKPQLSFDVLATDSQVIPPPPLGAGTEMTGQARIAFDQGLRSVRVFVKISDNFSNVIAVHLNLGVAGTDGPIVLMVEDFAVPITDRTFTTLEVLFNGDVTKVDPVLNIASLYQAVREGKIYLEVETVEASGHIRGQIFPSP